MANQNSTFAAQCSQILRSSHSQDNGNPLLAWPLVASTVHPVHVVTCKPYLSQDSKEVGTEQKPTSPHETLLKVTALYLEICSVRNSQGDPEAVWAHALNPWCQDPHGIPVFIHVPGRGQDAIYTQQ